MLDSCGLVIKHNNEILLIKPKGIYGKNFSIPKGLIEEGEDYIDAAIRETYEEIGLKIEKKDIVFTEFNIIPYINNGTVSKRLHYFLVDLSMMDKSTILKSLKLQESEVETANFYHKEEAISLIFWRQELLLYQFL